MGTLLKKRGRLLRYQQLSNDAEFGCSRLSPGLGAYTGLILLLHTYVRQINPGMTVVGHINH
jgi:hypothetical protein